MDYAAFLARKAVIDPPTGLVDVPSLHDALFPFQRDIVGWALRRGRAALFAGTGLGKSLMELAWADALFRARGIDTLLLTPLAVAAQMVREAGKFGIPARQVKNQAECGPGINVTNYAKLAHFDLSKFGAIVLDESSILKAYDGKTRTALIDACRRVPFRLAATATPAPNDFMELGNHAEFLGTMTYAEMLAMFFVHDGGETQKWRLKGHAQSDFWSWLCSWAVMLRKPSDLGYANDGFDLPPLYTHQHSVAVEYEPNQETGLLFPVEAATLQERIAARRGTVADRVSACLALVIGSFRTKLAECHGSLNTPIADDPSIKPTQRNASADARRAELRKRTARTCDLITSAQKSSSLPRAEMLGSATSTAWGPKSLTRSSLSKAEDAQSADLDQAAAEPNWQLTTATTLAKCEGSCVSGAIMGSGISETTLICWQEQSNIFGTLDVRPWVVWCQTNAEQDALKAEFGDLAISIYGSLAEDEKERLHQEWLAGKAPILLTKCSIFGYGLNWQHCRDTVFVGLNDSFEQVFQAVRRFWRFGQTKPVNVHFIASEIEGAVVANLRRKEADAERMAEAMIAHMADLSATEIRGTARTQTAYLPRAPMTVPAFLGAA